jgi:hypothetical protein
VTAGSTRDMPAAGFVRQGAGAVRRGGLSTPFGAAGGQVRRQAALFRPGARSDSPGAVAAGLDDVARRDPDAVEAVFKKLNAVDEVTKARSLIMG